MDPIVFIAGSRDFLRPEYVRSWVEKLAAKYPNAVIVSGGARGVDRAAVKAARAAGLDTLELCVAENDPADVMDQFQHLRFRQELRVHGDRAEQLARDAHLRINPPWHKTFRDSAFARTRKLIELADYVVCFYDGKSPGTRYTIKQASEAGKLKLVVQNEDLVLRELRDMLGARAVEEIEEPAPRDSSPTFDYIYVWGNNDVRAERKRQPCRIVATGAKNTVLIEFEDGKRWTTSRHAVRARAAEESRTPKAEQAATTTRRRRNEQHPQQTSLFGVSTPDRG